MSTLKKVCSFVYRHKFTGFVVIIVLSVVNKGTGKEHLFPPNVELILNIIFVPYLIIVVYDALRDSVAAAKKEFGTVAGLGIQVFLAYTAVINIFASIYHSLWMFRKDFFSAKMSMSTAIYFSTTIMTTTGFGDILPTHAVTRIIVSLHMLIAVAVQITILAIASNYIVTRMFVGEVKVSDDTSPDK